MYVIKRLYYLPVSIKTAPPLRHGLQLQIITGFTFRLRFDLRRYVSEENLFLDTIMAP